VRTAVAAGNDALERGIAVIDEVLGRTRLADLSGIAVGTGPGGFTGLRISLAYAKGLAFAAGLPLAGVSSYDALEPPEAPATHATFVHGRSGVACVRLRAGGNTNTMSGSYEELAEALAARLPRGEALTSYGASAGVVPALAERGITVQAIPTEAVVPALAVARRAIARAVFGDAHAARADYGEPHYAERPRDAAGPS